MFKIKLKTIVILLLSLTVILTSNLSANQRYGKQKVVYHINFDNPIAQSDTLRNIHNHIRAVGKNNIDVKVVMHGKGLSMLLEPDAVEKTGLNIGNATDAIQDKIVELKYKGVSFEVCENTLQGRHINYEDDLFDVNKEDIVPSGVAELVRLQSLGYAYIRP